MKLLVEMTIEEYNEYRAYQSDKDSLIFAYKWVAGELSEALSDLSGHLFAAVKEVCNGIDLRYVVVDQDHMESAFRIAEECMLPF